MAYRNLTLSRDDPIITITIERPPANALDSATLLELGDALDAIEADDALRAVVLTGAGRECFVAGADIAEVVGGAPGGHVAILERGNVLMNRLARFPRPVIAAINGLAVGGGCELALACDLRLAAETAQLGLPEITLGVVPGWGGMQRLPRLIGRARALELLMSGDLVGSVDAFKYGLVNRVVADDALLHEAQALGHRLARWAPLAMALIKQRLNDGADEALPHAVAADELAAALVLQTEDAKRGITAHLARHGKSG